MHGNRGGGWTGGTLWSGLVLEDTLLHILRFAAFIIDYEKYYWALNARYYSLG